MIVKQSIVFSCLLNIVTALFEGDDCVIQESGYKGKCISFNDCEYAKKLIQQARKTPQTCGFNGRIPLVCCPSASISVQKCNDYFDINKQIYASFSGTPAFPKEFPHMAAIGYEDNKNKVVWLCGGTLISERYVLTAAHCTYSKEYGYVKWVRLGDLDLQNTTEDASPRDLRVSNFTVHPDFKPPLHYHDIALIRFEGPIAFNIFYKPACLNTEQILPTNKLQATGWGQTGYAESQSSILMKVDLEVVEHQKCQKFYKRISNRRLVDGILDQFQICAGDDSGKGRDTCPGDSGGPLHYRKISDNPKMLNHFVVVGITSFGKICGILGPTAGVYTRVSAYIEWIEDIVWPIS